MRTKGERRSKPPAAARGTTLARERPSGNTANLDATGTDTLKRARTPFSADQTGRVREFKELANEALKALKSSQRSRTHVATKASQILGLLAGDGAGQIESQQITHWATAPSADWNASTARTPTNRDQLWSFILALVQLGAWAASNEDRRQKTRRMAELLRFRAVPIPLVHAAASRDLSVLERAIRGEESLEFTADESPNDVLATLTWLLAGTEADGNSPRRSLLCVAALSPPHILRHPEAGRLLARFVELGGSYALTVPFDPALDPRAGVPAAGRYRKIEMGARRTVTRIRELVGEGSRQRIRLVCIRGVGVARTVLAHAPPLAGVEARPVLLHSVDPTTRPASPLQPRVACLLTDAGRDRFLRRYPDAGVTGDEGTDAEEAEAVSAFFSFLIEAWEKAGFDLGTATLRPELEWQFLM